MSAVEANLDGLVGPTHHHGGLSPGNLASEAHGREVSHPRRAALEGLAKMQKLQGFGLVQGVLPPHERPDVEGLRRLGFTGSDAKVLETAYREEPEILSAFSSASSMWAANAATVSPAADTADGRVHFTPANLALELHRALEPVQTARILRAIFPDTRRFVHHDALPGVPFLSDEGAANHIRLCREYGEPGIEVFVYGRRGSERTAGHPRRQTLEASRAVARRHGLEPGRTCFVRESAVAIEAGAFHADVVAVSDRDVLLVHGDAFADQRASLDELRRKFETVTRGELVVVEVPRAEISLADAVSTYLFNGQLVSPPGGRRILVLPIEARENARVRTVAERIAGGESAVDAVEWVDLGESMRNGGGPACLRLRVVVGEEDLRASPCRIWLDDALASELEAWIGRHYREELRPADIPDPALLEESRRALDELTQILRLGSLYRFQME